MRKPKTNRTQADLNKFLDRMNKPTLLLIGNHLYSPNLNKNVWHYMAERLSARGWKLTTTSNQLFPPFRLLDMVWTILTKHKQYNLAQIDVFSEKAFIWSEVCTCFLRILHKPIILTLHGGKLPEFAAKHPKRVTRVLESADRVISPSPYHQKELAKYHPDIRLIPNPIDLQESIYLHRGQVRPKLIWVRAFHKVYNPSMVPKVLKRLLPDFPNIHIIMIGPDKGDGSLPTMLSLANQIGVRDHIEITGKISHPEIPRYLSKGDIYINTTNYDTAPRSLLEAMANGLCVVSTDVGGIPWLVNHDVDGLLVPARDPQAMADAVKRILTEPGLSSKLSANARKKAENHDWSIILPQWEKVFTELFPH